MRVWRPFSVSLAFSWVSLSCCSDAARGRRDPRDQRRQRGPAVGRRVAEHVARDARIGDVQDRAELPQRAARLRDLRARTVRLRPRAGRPHTLSAGRRPLQNRRRPTGTLPVPVSHGN